MTLTFQEDKTTQQYQEILDRADRLEELGVPKPTCDKIRAWADQIQSAKPLPKTDFNGRPITNFVPRLVFEERLFDVCPDCRHDLTGGYRHDMCPICMADFTQSVGWIKAYRELQK